MSEWRLMNAKDMIKQFTPTRTTRAFSNVIPAFIFEILYTVQPLNAKNRHLTNDRTNLVYTLDTEHSEYTGRNHNFFLYDRGLIEATSQDSEILDWFKSPELRIYMEKLDLPALSRFVDDEFGQIPVIHYGWGNPEYSIAITAGENGFIVSLAGATDPQPSFSIRNEGNRNSGFDPTGPSISQVGFDFTTITTASVTLGTSPNPNRQLSDGSPGI